MTSVLFKTIIASALRSVKPKNRTTLAKMSSKSNFETLSVTVPKPFVCHVELNRPDARNAMNYTMWSEMVECFKVLHLDPDCRVVIVSGAGKMFTSGLDYKTAMEGAQELADVEDPARKAKFIYNRLRVFQQSITQLELCNKPVLSAVHSACIGGGVALATASDIRYCTKDAWFQVKEVVLGMAADVGALQRLPRVVGSDSLARELCYTARKLPAAEALSCGLVSKVFEDKESMLKGVLEVAEDIAAKSPIAIQGTKNSLVYSRDRAVQEGLNHIVNWNQLMLQSEDFTNAVVALATKQTDITFAKF